MPQLTIILGGARSGKSTFAERLASAHGPVVTYLATAQALDDEMTERIARHRADRPGDWRTVECPLDPSMAIRDHAGETSCFLLDCMTLLVSNLVLLDEATADARVNTAIGDLLDAYRAAATDLIIVSNEVGLGLVPEYPLGRIYRDCLGRANQRLAAEADAAYFLVAGLPLDLKALACCPESFPGGSS